jgi:hypothetical protein
MAIPARLPTRLPNYKPAPIPGSGASEPPQSPYDTGLGLGIIRFTGTLIGKDIQNGGDHPYGDSWLVEARNLTTGAYSTVKYELCWDAEEPNPGFMFVYDDGACGDPVGAAMDGGWQISFYQGDVFSVTANEGDYFSAIALEAKPDWCVVRVEAINNISGNMSFSVE